MQDSLTQTLERLAIAMVGLTTRALSAATPGTELTFPQWRVLVILGESQDGATISDIAARVGVTLPATGRLVRRLERRGLVRAATDDLDRRATRARLTAAGADLREAIVVFRGRALAETVRLVGDPSSITLDAGLTAITAELSRFA